MKKSSFKVFKKTLPKMLKVKNFSVSLGVEKSGSIFIFFLSVFILMLQFICTFIKPLLNLKTAPKLNGKKQRVMQYVSSLN